MSEIITITLETGNAAFAESPATEIARILRKLADQFERDGDPEILVDHNGNTVGRVTVEKQ